MLVCVMAFGGFSDSGGRVLGLRVGGGSGMGVKTGKGCRAAEPLADGEMGENIEVEKVAGYPTETCSSKALLNKGIGILGGDGGGEGVVDMDKKVGPRGVAVTTVDVSEEVEDRKRS